MPGGLDRSSLLDPLRAVAEQAPPDHGDVREHVLLAVHALLAASGGSDSLDQLWPAIFTLLASVSGHGTAPVSTAGSEVPSQVPEAVAVGAAGEGKGEGGTSEEGEGSASEEGWVGW